MSQDKIYMQSALEMAEQAAQLGEVPVGAVVVYDNQIISRAHNKPITAHDPSAHAEIMAMREAGLVLDNYRLINCTLYVTLEPCLMCVGAMVHARIGRVVYGAEEPKTGAMHSKMQAHALPHLNHQLDVTAGVLAKPCGEILKQFFQSRR